MKILLLDNFDSFTYMLADYVEQNGITCEVLRNNVPIATIDFEKYGGILLSPGPETPQKAGNLMQVIENQHLHKPILGVCLGHQAIGSYFGADLLKAKQPMHGKISAIFCEPDELFNQIPQSLKVVRYHSLILENPPACLKVTAQTASQEIMAITHQTLPIKGIQFHPEAALTEFGKQMIKNWIDFCVKTKFR
jgi:anthranilate synthase/aminodeoxychorismate synthase-like glutamine amidotransferase